MLRRAIEGDLPRAFCSSITAETCILTRALCRIVQREETPDTRVDAPWREGQGAEGAFALLFLSLLREDERGIALLIV